ncbi:type II secretion system protein [Candidatus Uhrbacteria bacterium]|nr:type II secretion system protein [Candidatus Uhrbacteria bacterium]
MPRVQKGFTLLELLVVVAIIALLTAIAMVSLDYFKARARDSRRIANIAEIKNALSIYNAHHENYPVLTETCLNGIDDPLTRVLTADQVSLSPISDPTWPAQVPDPAKPKDGHCYTYKSLDDGKSFELTYFLELGAVGIPGHNAVRP